MSEIPIREMTRNAVKALRGKANYSQIIKWVTENYGEKNNGTLRAQVIACSVNQPSRIHYPENKKPRESDPRYDFFYSTGRGEVELYSKEKHGSWGITLQEGKPKITNEGKLVTNSDLEEFFFVEKDFQSTTKKKEDSQYLHQRFKILHENLKTGLSESFDNSKSKVGHPFNQGSKEWREYQWLTFARKGTFFETDVDGIQFQVSIHKDEDLSVMIWLDGLAKETRKYTFDKIRDNPDQFNELLRELPPTYYIGAQTTHEDYDETLISEFNDEFRDKIIERISKRKGELYVVRYISENEAIQYDAEIINEISNTFKELIPLADFLGKTPPNAADKAHSCFILTQYSDSKYDDVEGKQYQYDNQKPNSRKLIEGSKFIIQSKINNENYFVGCGKINNIEESQGTSDSGKPITKFVAKFAEYHKFDPPKLRTSELYADMKSQKAYGSQPPSLLPITRQLYAKITGDNSVIINNEKFQKLHQLFKQEMLERSNDIPFENFEHPGILDSEITYKQEILEKTAELRNLKNLVTWKENGQLIEQIKKICSPKICKNLLMGENYGVDGSSAASLHLVSKSKTKEYEEILFNFFDSAISRPDEFPIVFDNLINFLQENKLKVDWRFITYLAFIANPKSYIHVHPTRFENILNFYQIPIKLRANYSWENYSIILESIKSLKIKLSEYGDLDNIQIHSYIWIASSLTTKEGESGGMTINLDPFIHALEWKPNLILYGPPGTGKTFHANEIAEAIAGRRPKIKEMSNLAKGAKIILDNISTPLEYNDFKKLASEYKTQNALTPEETITRDIRANVDNLKDRSLFTYDSPKYGLNLPTTFARAAEIILLAENKPLHSDRITEIAMEKNMISRGDESGITPTRTMNQVLSQDVKNNNAESIFIQTEPATYGLRTQITSEFLIHKVTFHPSYSYEDFVEGYRPDIDNNTTSQYKLKRGIFYTTCEIARENPDSKTVLIIDEINRGNIPKILGELITLIEEDKRKKKYALSLAYSQDEFFVPENLRIIGTMNTADKSLMQMDDALKRRFVFEELMPDTDALLEHLKNEKVANAEDYKKILDRINEKILGKGEDDAKQKMKQFRDRQIGHSYFWKVKNNQDLQSVIKYDIIPLLQDYFYGDYNEIQKILGDKIISDDSRPTNLVTDKAKSNDLKTELLKI